MGELTVQNAEVATMDTDIRLKIQNFTTMLNKQPKESEVQINKHANDSRYLPISFLEMNLDEMFFGHWSTKNFSTSIVANEIIGHLELEVLHPTTGRLLTRIGAGAVMVQQKKDSDITDASAKIKNTLTKDYPHLKAECFRNACLSLGKSFGRDLNREYQDQYNPLVKEPEPKINEAADQELKALLKEHENWHQLKASAIGMKEVYMAKGLPEKYAYDLIQKRLSELK